MPMLTHPPAEAVADTCVAYEVVVGVDTHRDTHALQMLTAAGGRLAACQVPNTAAGFVQALAWLTEHAPTGAQILIGIEGTGSYGKPLTRALTTAGYQVIDVPRVRRADPRRGKSDAIDAHAIAQATLTTDLDQRAAPRADGDREALRILLVAHRDLTTAATAATAATNRIKDLLRTSTSTSTSTDADTDRDLARRKLTQAILRTLTRRRGRATDTRHQAIRRGELTRLARHLLDLRTQLTANKATLTEVLTTLTGDALLDLHGVGPVTAAQAVITYSHPGRVRNDAAYAALAGTNPIPASSGQTTGRHRLNRGGDRQLNAAIHTIALTRTRCCNRTRAYITRRRAQGRTDRDIRRSLKRYITRELYRTITAAMT